MRLTYFIGAAIIFAIGALSGGWIPTDASAFRIGLRLLFLLIAISFARWAIILHAKQSQETWSSKEVAAAKKALENDPADPTALTDFIVEVLELADSTSLSGENLESFLRSTGNQTAARRCVVETIDIEETHYRRTTETDFVLGHTGDTMFVTLFRAEKGELLDSLSATDADGRRLSILSRKDAMAVLWSVVRALVRQAMDGVAFSDDSARATAHAELELYYGAPLVLPRGEQGTVMQPSVMPPAGSDPQRQLDALMDELTNEYPVIAMIGADVGVVAGDDRYFKVTHSTTHRLHPRSAKTNSPREQLQNFLRQRLMVANLQFEFDAGKALRCVDYHLRVNAPHSSVIGEVLFWDRDSKQPIVKAKSQRGHVTRYHSRTPQPHDQPFAHLYTRDLARSDAGSPVYNVRFYERLPGAVGRAMLASLALLWVVWATGLSAASNTQGLDADSLALLLAVQGGLVAWIVSDGMRANLGTSLTARASMALTVGLSLAASILFVMTTVGRFPRAPAPDTVSFWFLDDWWWMTLMLMCFINAAYMTSTFFVRQLRTDTTQSSM